MMKVAVVLDGLWVGGTERSTVEILPYLIRADIHPILICLHRRPEEGVERQVLDAGYDVRFLSAPSFLQKLRQLRKLFRTERPHLAHSSLFEANLLTRFASMGLRLPVLNSIVNTPYAPVRFRDPAISAVRLKAVQQVDAWTSRHLTTHFHAVSHFAKECAVKHLKVPESEVTVVERGRDPSRLGEPSMERRNSARRQLGIAQDAVVLVNVGRHEFQKNQECLIAAVARVVQEIPGVTLLLAGRKGSASDRLVALRDRLDLGSAVRFFGHAENVPDLLASADLFVFPSLFEGMPGALIEAMALGLPIVASDIPSNREVVEENRNAILVAPDSSEALAEAILHLIRSDELRKAYAERSHAIFREKFTLEKIAPRMIELYRRIGGIHRSPTCS